MTAIVILTVLLTAASSAAYGSMMAFFVCAVRRRSTPPMEQVGPAPRVSILKPLAGCDDDLDGNLDSFARLAYPAFEVLLGVASAEDPAFAAARRFVSRHPRLDARVVVTDPEAALNPKVAQLVGLEREARGDVLVISDSNVRVESGYLWSLVRELRDPAVGMATSLFSGTGERSIGAALENLQTCAWTAPTMAALNAIGEPLAVGKSMALRRRDLARVGGFAAAGHVLAEDCVLGRMVVRAGFALRVANGVVENRNVGCSMRRTIERHTRWAKVRRSLHPLGFAFEPLLNPIVVASVGVVAAPCRLSAAVLVSVCIAESAFALLAVRLLRGPLPLRYAPLEVVRAYATFACWLLAWASRKTSWRGHPMLLRSGSVIIPADAVSGQPVAQERAAV